MNVHIIKERRGLSVAFFALLLGIFFCKNCFALDIELWKRFEASYQNTTWNGNPFDLEVKGVFTSPSGRTLTQVGFYAGENTWQIFFMPDEEGEWAYETDSSDPDLDNKVGRFTCTASELLGQLIPVGNRWQLQDNGGDFPIIWNPPVRDGAHWGFRGRDVSDPSVQEALQFADKTVGARLLGFGALLIAPIDWADDWPQSSVPYIREKEGEVFYLPFWDQLNAKLDAARDRGMGAYIMLYSDDAQTPDHFGLKPYSQKELRFFRYVIARLACYPHVLWDSGIDIGEYRDGEWIDWYARWFNENDPWHHAVGSRTGGGSGGSIPATGTYYSTGGAYLPTRSALLDLFFDQDTPIAYTDHWRPFIKRGNWTHRKIRTAHWRCGLSGSPALYPDYNQGPVKHDEVLKGGQDIGHATHFFRHELRSDLLDIEPHDELIRTGDNAILASSPEREYIVYDEDGGSVGIDLSEVQGVLGVVWYNPRTGEQIKVEFINGGKMHTFTSPTTGEDWVLHLYAKQQ